jgi:hypothetical protein
MGEKGYFMKREKERERDKRERERNLAQCACFTHTINDNNCPFNAPNNQ